MGRHSSDRAAQTGSATTAAARQKTLLLALLVAATLVAWGVLVYAAIDFGGQARSGEPLAWVFLALSTIGAAACLFTTLILGARIVSVLRGPEQRVPRPQGGRRIAR